MIGRVEDITERKRAEEATEQLRATGPGTEDGDRRAAGGIAHDFNNLLARDPLRSEMALQMESDSPLYRSLNAIYTTGTASAALVQQLLGYARKRTIAPKLNRPERNGGADAAGAGETHRQGDRAGMDARGGVWPVKMDAAQVDRILTNLCVKCP